MSRKITVYFTLFFLGAILPVQAQRSSVYDKLTLDFESGLHIIQNSFTNNWTPTPSLQLASRVSFYLGNVEAGIRITRYNYVDRNSSEADFLSAFVYLGWEYPIKIMPRLSISPGIRFGNNLMLFDKEKVYSRTDRDYTYTFDSTESEFAYELTTRLDYSFANTPWKIHSILSYNRTLTYHPLPVTLFSVGISRTFSTPAWLKEFLK